MKKQTIKIICITLLTVLFFFVRLQIVEYKAIGYLIEKNTMIEKMLIQEFPEQVANYNKSIKN